jgi:hypothetical protein
MGIVIPRPPMRGKERRTIEANLKRHHELMKQFEAEGLDRNEASSKAMQAMKAEKAKGDV